MLRSKNNKRFLLAALLISAATTLFAQELVQGFFSVGPSKKVQFAKGNMQYDYSTSTYGFASEQYEIIGAGNATAMNTSTGVRDLFNWDERDDMPGFIDVLSKDEWQYLFGYDGGRTNAYSLFALSRIEKSPGVYVNGLTILPDEEMWAWPEGLNWNYTETGAGYAKNTFSLEDWARMEAAGAVFLPVGGYMGYSDYYSEYVVEDFDTHGVYWTSTEDPEDVTNKAFRIQFDGEKSPGGYFYDFEGWWKNRYQSVRSLKLAPTYYLSENDEPEVFAAKKAALEGVSSVYVLRTLRKAGYFNTLTLPFRVPDINDSPLKGDGVEVYEFVDASVIGDVLTLDITKRAASSLEAGVPYLIRWDNTGEVLKLLHFEDVTWDDDNNAENVPGGHVTFQGFYGKKHINDVSISGVSHSNLFLAANNVINWPTDGDDPSAKMLGFRAYFEVTLAGGGAGMRRRAPQSNGIYKGMPVQFRIVNRENTATGLEDTDTASPIPTKMMRDGQLIIIRNNVEYSISGQIIKK